MSTRQSVEIVSVSGVQELTVVQTLAYEIWNEHYPPIIGQAQVDYMLERGYTVEAMRRDIEEDAVVYEIARAKGRTLGFAAYGPVDDGLEWKLHKLYVVAATRGLGVGAALVESAVAAAIGRGCRALILQVNKQNALAIAAYERMGFTVREAAVFDIGDGFVMDDYVMERVFES